MKLKKLLLPIKLIKRIPFIHFYGRSKASLVLVKDSWEDCQNEAEQILYKKLRADNYYPTPHYQVSGITINIALVPFRLALIEKRYDCDEHKLARLLRKKKWRVLFYEPTKLAKDTHLYEKIRQEAKLQA